MDFKCQWNLSIVTSTPATISLDLSQLHEHQIGTNQYN